MGHAIQPGLYNSFKWLVGVLNRNISALDLENKQLVVLKDHVVLLGFNEIAQEVGEFYEEQLTPERVLLIDCDPEIIKHFQERKDSNVDPFMRTQTTLRCGENINLVRQKLLFPVLEVT